MKRKAKISRKTKETNINVELNIDGKGKYKVDTGIGFLDHMLEQLSKHSSMDMNCLLYTSPSPRDAQLSRMPSSA